MASSRDQPNGPSVVSIEITGFGFLGEGFARTEDGRFISVPHTAPGDRVRVRVGPFRRNRAWGEVVEWLRRADVHIPPDCPHYDRCSGCALRHLSVRDEGRWKRAQARQILERYGPEGAAAVALDWVGTGERRGHRVRGRYRVAVGDDERVVVGLRSIALDGAPVDIRDCPAQAPEFRAVMSSFGSWLDHRPALARRLAQVELWTAGPWRSGDDAPALLVAATRDPLGSDERGRLHRWAEAEGVALVVSGALAESRPDSGQSPAVVPLVDGVTGRAELALALPYSAPTADGQSLPESRRPPTVRVPWGTWYPANLGAAESMIAWALDRLGAQHELVLDLCAGVGSISVALAGSGRRVLAVDRDHRALKALAQGAAAAGLDNLAVRPGGLRVVLRKLRRELADEPRPSAAVINPMRRPLGPRALTDLAPLGIQQVIYLGPAAVSAARDGHTLSQLGYGLARAAAIDLHPATAQLMLGLDLRLRRPHNS